MARPKGIRTKRRSEMELISDYEDKIAKLHERMVRKNATVLASIMSDVILESGGDVADFILAYQGTENETQKQELIQKACDKYLRMIKLNPFTKVEVKKVEVKETAKV